MRYALYFSPADKTPLCDAASHWLGRNVFTGNDEPQVQVDGFMPEELMRLTADPRRYGFHATLKAPFALAPGRTEEQLLQALTSFSAECEAFEIAALSLSQLGSFFALVPAVHTPPLHAFADETVRRFESFRAPLSEEDLQRRNPETLSDGLRAHLLAWGYPYVFEAFQFHMTLTGPVPSDRQGAMRAALDRHFAAFTGKPLVIDSLSLFIEPQRGAPFGVHAHWPLGGVPNRKMS